MDDYIFVEGKRYISAKRAANETGYTSDYIGQMAREGRVDSKKVGRVRFVNEDQVKSYTVDSDRKKTAAIRISDATPVPVSEPATAPEPTPASEPVPAEAPTPTPILEPEPAPAPESVPEPTTPEPAVAPVAEPVAAPVVNVAEKKEEAQATLNNAVKSLQDSLDSLASTPVNMEGIEKKAVALAIALMIVFGPYLSSQTGVFSKLTNSFALAYEAVVFDMEEISMQVYTKTTDDGVLRLVTDSLAYSEERMVSGLAGVFYSYSQLDDLVLNAPKEIVEREIGMSIDVPAKQLKASAIDSAADMARGVYEWFYIRGGE